MECTETYLFNSFLQRELTTEGWTWKSNLKTILSLLFKSKYTPATYTCMLVKSNTMYNNRWHASLTTMYIAKDGPCPEWNLSNYILIFWTSDYLPNHNSTRSWGHFGHFIFRIPLLFRIAGNILSLKIKVHQMYEIIFP